MGSTARLGSRKRIVATTVAASLLVVLFIAGLAFVNSIGAARVAENARSLHWANAALGTTSLARAVLVQTITFEDLAAEGLADVGAVAYANEQLDSVRSELQQLRDTAGDSPSGALLIHFIAEVESAVRSLAAGAIDDARDEVFSDMEERYMDLVALLKAEQQDIQESIGDNTAAASRTHGYVLFFLTLAIPAAAVIVYWLTARRQVREFRLQSELELEAERAVSRAKDSFIAGLSHELRTPLTSIYGFAEILTDDAGDAEQVTELSQIIAKEAAEMSRMVDDLLAASRMESTGLEIEMSATEVQEVIESAAVAFERAGIQIAKPSTEAVVHTDAARLRHILVNLLSNAAVHGGRGIGVEVSEAAGTVEISVVDNGTGVQGNLEDLFEGFVHAGSAPLLSGTIGIGLGLAVASRMASLLGGQLTYQRFAGKTYFTVAIRSSSAKEDADELEPGADDIEELERSEGESVADVIRALSR